MNYSIQTLLSDIVIIKFWQIWVKNVMLKTVQYLDLQNVTNDIKIKSELENHLSGILEFLQTFALRYSHGTREGIYSPRVSYFLGAPK